MNVDARPQDRARAILVGCRKPPAIIAGRALAGLSNESKVKRYRIKSGALNRPEAPAINGKCRQKANKRFVLAQTENRGREMTLQAHEAFGCRNAFANQLGGECARGCDIIGGKDFQSMPRRNQGDLGGKSVFAILAHSVRDRIHLAPSENQVSKVYSARSWPRLSDLPMGVDRNLNGDERLPARARADWSDLRVFLHVAESGSISAAARTLQMSQPTVSQRLRELELRLNTQLVARGPQGVVLTEAGAKIKDQVAAMQRSASTIDRLLRECDDRAEGRVKIAAPDGLGSFWISPRIPALQRANPGLTLSLDGGLWPDSPLRDDVDISIQYDARRFGEHVVEPLATVHYAAFAAQSYLELYGTPKSHAELATHRTVHHSAVQLQKETWDPKAEAARTLSAYNVETNCSATLIMSVLAGAGVAFLPTCAAAFIPNIVMLGEAPAASPKLYLVYDPAIARVARASRGLEWLRDIFAPAANPWFGEDFIHPREFASHSGAGKFIYHPPD